nr:recombinase family protein [Brevibacillus laterosporus]
MEALNTYGCETLFTEKISGRKKGNRVQFNVLMETVTKGDTIVITKLDRMARNTRGALDINRVSQRKRSLFGHSKHGRSRSRYLNPNWQDADNHVGCCR